MPLSVEAAAAAIQEEAGKALDPRAVEAFLRDPARPAHAGGTVSQRSPRV
jgi:HD-GYP domain-containing protein (c-di-GMP phosphodiesterase class II)